MIIRRAALALSMTAALSLPAANAMPALGRVPIDDVDTGPTSPRAVAPLPSARLAPNPALDRRLQPLPRLEPPSSLHVPRPIELPVDSGVNADRLTPDPGLGLRPIPRIEPTSRVPRDMRMPIDGVLSHDPPVGLRYHLYRDGFLRRHLVSQGRGLSWVWLKEYEPGIDPPDLLRHVRRFKPPIGVAKTYVPWLTPDGIIYGGDENPLLRGGLAMAALALEHMVTRNGQLLAAALELLSYAEANEHVDASGPTGFFLRTRWPGNVHDATGRPYFYASVDELSGLVLGLFHLHRALVASGADDDAIQRVRGMAARLGRQLQANGYLILPPAGLPQERHKGWAGGFLYQWFFEEALLDITGERFRAAQIDTGDALWRRVKDLAWKGGGKDEDLELMNQVLKAADNISVQERAITTITALGVQEYMSGEKLRLECTIFNVGRTIKVPEFAYFNLAMMLHLALPTLQRGAEGKLPASHRAELVKQLRRVLRGTIFADGSKSRIDADRLGFAWVGMDAGDRALLAAASGTTLGIATLLLATDCDPEVPVGAREPDYNYYIMAVTAAYDLLDGDSNPYFKTAVWERIDAVRARFGTRLPLSERKVGEGAERRPLVEIVAPLSVRSATNPGGRLIADHNPEQHIGSAFVWEQPPSSSRILDGGNADRLDEGVSNDAIADLYRRGVDVVREGSGIDYLLPTALLAYRKGVFRQELLDSRDDRRVDTQAERLAGRTSTAADYLP